MNNEELLQQVLNMTLERLGKQASTYESEIANLHAQILVLNAKVEELSKPKSKSSTSSDA
jgi:prefoldin subunit 5